MILGPGFGFAIKDKPIKHTKPYQTSKHWLKTIQNAIMKYTRFKLYEARYDMQNIEVLIAVIENSTKSFPQTRMNPYTHVSNATITKCH
jgi:hypothetical protein